MVQSCVTIACYENSNWINYSDQNSILQYSEHPEFRLTESESAPLHPGRRRHHNTLHSTARDSSTNLLLYTHTFPGAWGTVAQRRALLWALHWYRLCTPPCTGGEYCVSVVLDSWQQGDLASSTVTGYQEVTVLNSACQECCVAPVGLATPEQESLALHNYSH